MRGTGQLLLAAALGRACVHFQRAAYEFNAKCSWGRVPGSQTWRWTPLLVGRSVSCFRRSCGREVEWVSAAMNARLAQSLRTRCEKHLHLVWGELALSFIGASDPRLVSSSTQGGTGSCCVTGKIQWCY